MLKKYLVSFAAIVLSLQGLPAVQAQQLIPAPPQLAAKAYILIDANTGHILVENNADMPLPPASLAKMMTTYIVSKEIAAVALQRTIWY